KEGIMFKRSTWMAMLTLGLGTVLGYTAAGGRLSFPAGASAGTPASSPGPAANKDCCTPPEQGTVVTRFQEGVGDREWKTPVPGNPRGATTGPTQAPGYDHPNQFVTVKPTQIAPNMEPVIVHPTQLKEAMAKLAKAKEKHGKSPNFLVFLLDD